MDLRRLLLIAALSFLCVTILQVVGPRIFPQWFAPAVQVRPADALADADADAPANAAPPIAAEDLPSFPSQTVSIGSLDPADGYRMKVTLSTDGATVRQIEMSDPRYREVDNRDNPLRVVGNVPNPPVHSFAVMAPDIDRRLKEGGKTLRDVSWELVQGGVSEDTATFRYPVPGGLTLTKTFRLTPSDDPEDVTGYLLDVSVTATNEGEASQNLTYWLQGPVGVPLESLDSSRATFVELKGGVVEDPADPDDVEVTQLTAAEIVEYFDEGTRPPQWTAKYRWIGPDVQYFAAFLTAPAGRPYLDFVQAVRPTLVANAADSRHAAISMILQVEPTTLAAGQSLTHELQGYFGPKREELLSTFGGTDAIAFGWFGWISRLMLKVLDFFHSIVGLPYALAIMALTCCVRLCLMPITLKVAANGEKMKEMQPKIEALKEKYKDDREALGKAQMELMMKEGNPLAGCLPLLLQFPVFIGLYNALLNSVDLRLARFLWADNLAAPDHLVNFGFQIPLLGSWFNLLPIITIALFIGQQKLFMPPAVTDEQKAQYKMINFIMLFMGFMFYNVPAGLCLYFIASSLWSVTERTAIKRKWIKLPAKKDKPKKPPGKFKQYLQAKYEEAQMAADSARNENQGQLQPGSRKADRDRNRGPQSLRGGKKSKRGR